MLANFSQIANNAVFNAGIKTITDDFMNNWIGPVFLLIVAAISITFLINRQFRQLAIFLVIAAIVGAAVFFGSALFGKDGTFSKFAKNKASTINTVVPTQHDYLNDFIE